MLESNISHLSSLRAEIEKQILNMSVYEAYITDISVRAERFMQEKGKDALKAIGFNYISHSNGSVYTKNTYDESRDYTNNKPECFFINIECSMVGGNWENNDVNDFDIDEQREILVAKMVKDFEEITGEKIKINQISLEGNNTPMIQVMFK